MCRKIETTVKTMEKDLSAMQIMKKIYENLDLDEIIEEALTVKVRCAIYALSVFLFSYYLQAAKRIDFLVEKTGPEVKKVCLNNSFTK